MINLSEEEAYLFDLRGYIILKGALSDEELATCSADFDRWSTGGDSGDVVVTEAGRQEGISFHQLYEGGPVWENMIDHPAWFGRIVQLLGTDNPENFDGEHGPAFIDECFGILRRKGGAVRLHSGGHLGTIRTQYRYHGGFHCGQVNVLCALNDIGPGDGATMVVPGSHKSNLRHPQSVAFADREDEISVDGVVGAIEVHLEKGDALMFVDALAHGSARRSNDGERRVAIYRYGPSWGYFRQKYRPSRALMERLTPLRRQIVNPHD